MKKNNLRSLIWAALSTFSLCAYLYMHATSVKEFGVCPSALQQHQTASDKDSKVFLPDIALAKKILNITKIVMPKD